MLRNLKRYRKLQKYDSGGTRNLDTRGTAPHREDPSVAAHLQKLVYANSLSIPFNILVRERYRGLRIWELLRYSHERCWW